MHLAHTAALDPTGLAAWVPPSLRGAVAGLELWQWLGLVVFAVASYTLARIASFVLMRLLTRIARHTKTSWDDGLLAALRPPSRFFFTVFGFHVAVGALALPDAAALVVGRVIGTVLIGAVTWTAVRVVSVVAAHIELRAQEAAGEGAAAELQVRGVETNVRVLRRVVNVCIGIVGVALILTQFEIVRSVGVSLLASAGLAGVVLGFAAQRTFGSLIAGIQLSATQPIRLGDVVIVEKEWGTIEEITLTYVVVKVWDERRLVVPVSRFLEQPFENWSKVGTQIHGSVMLYVDWMLPVDELRKEAMRVIEGHPLWDGRTKSVQVTQASEHTVEVRVLVSAEDPSKLWDLRVDLRERMVKWLQDYEGGRFLPRMRVDGPSLLRAS